MIIFGLELIQDVGYSGALFEKLSLEAGISEESSPIPLNAPLQTTGAGFLYCQRKTCGSKTVKCVCKNINCVGKCEKFVYKNKKRSAI